MEPLIPSLGANSSDPARCAMAKIYIASKAKHRPRWRALRDSGVNINSRWIDTPDLYIGTTAGDGVSDLDYEKLWIQCIEDVINCDMLILYVEPGEVLKGALVEVGAALAAGRMVIACADLDGIEGIGTWWNHPLVEVIPSRSIGEVMGYFNGQEKRVPSPAEHSEDSA